MRKEKNIKLRVKLLGRRSHRTPLAYSAYQSLSFPRIEFVDESVSADIILFSCLRDIREAATDLLKLQQRNCLPKLVVISEEPFWDLIWEEEIFNPLQWLEHEGLHASVNVFNHFSSELFHFSQIPYFITSDNVFFDRYSRMFARNAQLTCNDWQARWRQVNIKAAFYMEKRVNEKYDRAFPEDHIYGLCRYRSLVAEGFDRPGVVRTGVGWGSEPRQSLPDWHLDKLQALDQNACFISALENTHQPNYITEKLFDAFACGGIPLYWASEMNRVHQLVESGSFVNLYGLSVEEACVRLDNFSVTEEFAENYKMTQQRLADLFSSPDRLRAERMEMVERLVDVLAG